VRKFISKLRQLQKSQAGFGLVEVLISASVIVLILTAIAASSAFSLKTSSELKFRGIALSKAQELMEALRRERSIVGWDSFPLITAGAPGQYTYCFNNDSSLKHDTFSWDIGACGVAANQPATVNWENNDYIRELVVTTTPDQADIVITVYWQGRNQQIELKQTLNKWR